MCAICHSFPINGSQIHLLFHCADLSPNRSIKKLLPITFNANILKKMINLNLFWVKYCDNENNFVSGSDTNKPPSFEGWFIVMKIVLCIEGGYSSSSGSTPRSCSSMNKWM